MGSIRRRAGIWVLILAVVCGGGWYYWQNLPPQRTKRYLKQMQHPNAIVASEAWSELSHLFFTDWAAYYLLLDEVSSQAPISFLLEKQRPEGLERELFSASGKPIYYKSDGIYCRTLGEAILAILHNDPKHDTPFEGDWRAWWQKHRGLFR